MANEILACYFMWLLCGVAGTLTLVVFSGFFNLGGDPKISKSSKFLLVSGIPVALFECLYPGAARSEFFQTYGMLANYVGATFVVATVTNVLRGF